MRIHSDYLTVQSAKQREFINITGRVKDAAEKSGIHDGLILISSLHGNSGVFINDEDPGLLQDIDEWLGKMAPFGGTYHHSQRAESNAAAHLQSLLLHHQALVSLAQVRLELGPWQYVMYAELDGMRPKRILIKVM